MTVRRERTTVARQTAGPSPSRTSVAISGNLDDVRPDGTVIAWCWSPDEPTLRREVGVWIDGVEVARALCDQMRPDLIDAGVGDGAHGMVLLLPASVAQPGANVTLMLRDVATGRQIGVSMPVTWTELHPALLLRVMTGNLDGVTEDGWVSGWCWYPAYPDEHVGLTILVNGKAVGSTEAVNFRPDLREARIGDGTHGFLFALPRSVLADKGLLRISVRETLGSAMLNEAVLTRAGPHPTVEERIQDLEKQISLLRSRIAEIARQRQARKSDQTAGDLFAAVASVFRTLAEGDVGTVIDSRPKTVVEDPHI